MIILLIYFNSQQRTSPCLENSVSVSHHDDDYRNGDGYVYHDRGDDYDVMVDGENIPISQSQISL